MNDPLGDIQREIANIQNAEERLEYLYIAQGIIQKHSFILAAIGNLPVALRQRLKKDDGYFHSGYCFRDNGFEFGDYHIEIIKNGFIIIKKGEKIVFKFLEELIYGEKTTLQEIKRDLTDFAKIFLGELKTMLATYKKEIQTQIENF